jgi:urocanate hydratase
LAQSQILYADAEGVLKIPEAFNQAIAKGNRNCSSGSRSSSMFPVPIRLTETSFMTAPVLLTADMAIQNVVATVFRGATWFLSIMAAA